MIKCVKSSKRRTTRRVLGPFFGRNEDNEARSRAILWEKEGDMRRIEPPWVCRRTTHPAVYASLPPLVGVPGSFLAGRCHCVHLGEHELSRPFYTFSREVEEERVLQAGYLPFSQ